MGGSWQKGYKNIVHPVQLRNVTAQYRAFLFQV